VSAPKFSQRVIELQNRTNHETLAEEFAEGLRNSPLDYVNAIRSSFTAGDAGTGRRMSAEQCDNEEKTPDSSEMLEGWSSFSLDEVA